MARTKQYTQPPALLYEFYSIGEGAAKIEHIGTSNSFCAGRHRLLSSIIDRVCGSDPQSEPEQYMPIYTRYKGDPYSAKHGECVMMFIRAKEQLFSVGIRVLEQKNVSLKDFDCRQTFATIYKTHRAHILEDD